MTTIYDRTRSAIKRDAHGFTAEECAYFDALQHVWSALCDINDAAAIAALDKALDVLLPHVEQAYARRDRAEREAADLADIDAQFDPETINGLASDRRVS